MSDLLHVYKNEIESLKLVIEKLKIKNSCLFKKNKNLVRNQLRLKKTLKETNLDDSWDYLDKNELN